jgi:LysM repeat protein
LSVVGLSAGITAAGAGAALATDYTVRPGDTLSEIAQANGGNWQQLAALNDLSDPDLILVGQTLRLDGAATTAERSVRRSTEATQRRSTKAAAERRKTERPVRKAERPSRSKTRPAGTGSAELSGAWSKVANCESSGNPRAVNPAGYYGLFQFDRQTWRSVGGSGNPAEASAGEQLMRAKKLYSQRGASPWPVCGRFLR